MDCNETRRLLDADLDGELDLVRHLEIESHLRVCPACARLAENARARRAALRETLPRFTAPPQLGERIRAALAAAPGSAAAVAVSAGEVAPVAVPPSAAVSVSSLKSEKFVFLLWQITGLAASLAFAVLVGFAWGKSRAHATLLVDEAIGDHIRSLQAGHLTDVASTDQHTVRPWFAGKLDFSPPVSDLASAGFPLTGGRLDHLDGRPAAALVFHRRQHAINVFVWPAANALGSDRAARNGYHTETWSQAGLNFLAVSDIPAAELTEFVGVFRSSQR